MGRINYTGVGALAGGGARRTGSEPISKQKHVNPGPTHPYNSHQITVCSEPVRDRYSRSAIPPAVSNPAAAVPCASGKSSVSKNASSTLPRPPSRSHSRSSALAEPTPPPALPQDSPKAAPERKHRFLGPMPEAPPTSVLQIRPATSQPRSRTAMAAMRQRQYQASTSPPSRVGFQPTPPSQLPSGVQRQHYSYQQQASITKGSDLCSGLDSRSASSEVLSSQRLRTAVPTQQESASRIRHRSTTPVRITMDAQLRREKIAARHGGTPPQASPLRRRATSVARSTGAQLSRQSWEGSCVSSKQTLKPTPPAQSQTKLRESCDATPAGALVQPTEQASQQVNRLHRHVVMDTDVQVSNAVRKFQTQAVSPVVSASERRRPCVPADATTCQNETQLEGYEVGPVIGEGGFCKVRSGRHIASGQCVAIKVINKV